MYARIIIYVVLLVTAFLAVPKCTIAGEYEALVAGQTMFFDPLLSRNGTVSCAFCHDPAHGYAQNSPKGIGNDGREGDKNTPTCVVAWKQRFQFWDQRADGLVGQSLLPLTNPDEMGNRSVDDVIARMQRTNYYPSLFFAAFGTQGITSQRMSKCFELFQRALNETPEAPADLYFAGQETALSPAAKRGAQLFVSLGCVSCHNPNSDYRDGYAHNTGISFQSGLSRIINGQRVYDPGTFAVLPRNLKTATTVRAWKTPTLRECTRTAPYMHDGSLKTLRDVVEHYARGGSRAADGVRDTFTDPRIGFLNMSEQDKVDLVTFLEEGFLHPHYPMFSAPAFLKQINRNVR